jgi:hypothetical protein
MQNTSMQSQKSRKQTPTSETKKSRIKIAKVSVKNPLIQKLNFEIQKEATKNKLRQIKKKEWTSIHNSQMSSHLDISGILKDKDMSVFLKEEELVSDIEEEKKGTRIKYSEKKEQRDEDTDMEMLNIEEFSERKEPRSKSVSAYSVNSNNLKNVSNQKHHNHKHPSTRLRRVSASTQPGTGLSSPAHTNNNASCSSSYKPKHKKCLSQNYMPAPKLHEKFDNSELMFKDNVIENINIQVNPKECEYNNISNLYPGNKNNMLGKESPKSIGMTSSHSGQSRHFKSKSIATALLNQSALSKKSSYQNSISQNQSVIELNDSYKAEEIKIELHLLRLKNAELRQAIRKEQKDKSTLTEAVNKLKIEMTNAHKNRKMVSIIFSLNYLSHRMQIICCNKKKN